jgi:hypothetical protein
LRLYCVIYMQKVFRLAAKPGLQLPQKGIAILQHAHSHPPQPLPANLLLISLLTSRPSTPFFLQSDLIYSLKNISVPGQFLSKDK